MTDWRFIRAAVVGLGVFLVSSLAYSAVYTVNRTIGSGSVTGTIETDGTAGALDFGNIVDWNLTLDDGISSFTILGPLSGANSGLLIFGSSFTATATDLMFDFSSDSGDFVLFQNPSAGSGINFWCIDDKDGDCAANGAGETVVTTSIGSKQFAGRAGVQSIASVVPVPAAAWLFGSALLSLAAVRRRTA